MTTKDNKPVTETEFMNELYRYKKGSVSRRHFMQVTGLSTAMAAVAGSVPSMFASPAFAAEDLGNRLNFGHLAKLHGRSQHRGLHRGNWRSR